VCSAGPVEPIEMSYSHLLKGPHHSTNTCQPASTNALELLVPTVDTLQVHRDHHLSYYKYRYLPTIS
jgi:hypothetical protein